MYALRCRPTPNNLNLSFISFSSFSSHDISEKSNLRSEKGALFEILVQLFTFKHFHNLSQMILVLFLIVAEDQNIIKINDNELANIRFEYLVH